MPPTLLGAIHLDHNCTKPEDTALQKAWECFFLGVGRVIARLLSCFLNALQL